MEHWISFLVIILFLSSCSEDNECLKRSGDHVEYMADLPAFSKLEIHNSIEVELVQHPDTMVTITTGENLKSLISMEVAEQTLIVKDNNRCNWMRDYNKTSIKIFHPNITHIAHQGNARIFSSDTLYYPSITLYSKNKTGDFDLILSNNKIVVSINDLSNVFLSGKTKEFFAGAYSGDGRIEAQKLRAEKVSFFHRGTNDILVYPVDLLKGKLVGLGNIIFYNEPATRSVEDEGPGQLLPGY